jgi:hypothetical protein
MEWQAITLKCGGVDPDVDLNGEVVFWGAHFDAADPTRTS